MKLTKYEHACLVLDELNQSLIIDPGMFATSLPLGLTTIVAVVITHGHADHLDKTILQTLVKNNPSLTIFAPQDVLDELSDIEAKKELAQPDVSHTAGSFALDFYGHDHAVIYEKVPCQNTAVMVNKKFYYPGDSFTEPKEKVELLAIPSGAPWMKVSEAMDFMKHVMPAAVFPTHDAVYSEAGKSFSNNWLEQEATSLGAAWKVLQTGDSIEV